MATIEQKPKVSCDNCNFTVEKERTIFGDPKAFRGPILADLDAIEGELDGIWF